MSAYRYLMSAGLYAFILVVLYGKREACPREFFTKKEGDLYKKISEEKRKKIEEVNFSAQITTKGGISAAKAEVSKDK
mgnify:CR=1 FL=1